MMVKIMSNSKRIKEKVHFYVSILAGAVQFCIGKSTPFYFSLAIFPLLLIVFTKKESYYYDYFVFSLIFF